MRVPSYGPFRARIMAVGEAPGQEEEREGRPFVGPAGKALRQWLSEVGIDPEEIFYTNLCKHRPPGNKLEKFFGDGGIPTTPVRDGLVELISEINDIQPNVILALGNFPLWALTGKARWMDKMVKGKRVRGFTGITDWRGSILHCTLVEGFKVIPTFHPAFLIREGMSNHGTFKTDLARVKDEAEFPEIRRPDKQIVLAEEKPKVLANYIGVVDREEDPQWEDAFFDRNTIKEVLLSYPSVPTTLDIEYAGSKLFCVGLGVDSETAFVLPTTKLSDILYVQSIVEQTQSFNAQNSMFDASILEWHYQMPIMKRVVFDTMICAYAANVELPKGLDYLISIYTDQPYHKGMVDWNLVKKGLQPLSIVFAYNGIDVWTQHLVMEEQIRLELTDKNTKDSFELLMRLLAPLWEMSRRGIRIDMGLMKYVKEELEGETAAKSFELMFLANSNSFINVKSGPEVSALLYDRLGLPVIKKNRTGPATDDKTLAALQIKAAEQIQKDAIMLIRQIRRARDLQSKFFDVGFDDDGRMRGTYNSTKTVTGRLASVKFWPTDRGTNQQNIPRDRRARRAFIADPGKVYGYADLEKAESLVVAHLCLDPLMLHDHSPGQNAHRNLGSKLFDKTPEELDEDEYYLSKKTRHAGNYMQGPITFMRNVNQDAHKTGVSITQSEARKFIEIYKEIHVGLQRWWKEVEDAIWKGRTLYNLIGFRRVFYGHVRSILPEAVAFVPQSTVGQVLNIGLLNLEGIPSPYVEERDLWSEYADIKGELLDCGFEILQQIHDAVGFQVDEQHAERAAPLLRRALSVPLRNPKTYEDFTIPVEVLMDLDPAHLRGDPDENGRPMHSNWGDAKVYTGDLVHA